MTTQSLTIKAQTRAIGDASTKTNLLRRSGTIPGVLYGKGLKPTPISIDAKNFVKEHTRSLVISLELDGKSRQVLMREVQRHPLKDTVDHVDFQEVTPDEIVKVRIPVDFVGLTREQQKEGSFRSHVKSLPVRCKVKDIPPKLEVNISHLKIEDSAYLGDVNFGPHVRIKGQTNLALATLTKL